jgi:hypothetical protein
MSALVDTLLNVGVFVFIGRLVGLYLKKGPEDADGAGDADR